MKVNLILQSNQETKKCFFLYRTLTASINPKILIPLICISLAIGFLIIYFNQPRWMIWQNGHYIEVKLDTEKYSLNQLKLYKEDRILNFKQIIPDCNTTQFFNLDGSENLWYGKNAKGELEYFTSLGLHPETGMTLKKITSYMIKTHICDSLN